MESAEITKSIVKVGKTFNVQAFKDLMDNMKSEIDGLSVKSKAIKVQGAPSETKSIELAGVAKKLNKAIDTARLDAKRPYLDFGKELDSIVRPVQKILTGIESDEKTKCKKYRNVLLAKQREQEAIAAKMAAKMAAKEILNPKATTLGGLNTAPPAAKETTGKVKTFSGSTSSYKTVFKPYLIDIAIVPKKYIMVDWKLVNDDIKDGIRDIPGLDIKEEVDMRLRG